MSSSLVPPLAPHLLSQNLENGSYIRKSDRKLSYQETLVNELSSETQSLSRHLDAKAEKDLAEDFSRTTLEERHKKAGKPSQHTFVDALGRSCDWKVDTLPISKEKAAVLTLTRPSWLPPKSKREERRHLAQYEQLMRASFELDKKRQRRLAKALTHKGKHLVNSVDVWDKRIIPHWNTAIRDPSTRDLWWQGIPSRVRGRVWELCIENVLTVNEATFSVALTKSRELEIALADKTDEETSAHGTGFVTPRMFRRLRECVHDTFPHVKIFLPDGRLHQALLDVLMAYLYYRQDIGWLDGVNFVAALLLLNLPTAKSFMALVNLLNRPLPLAVYSNDEPVLNRFVATFLTSFSQKLPKLYHHSKS